MEDLLSKLNNNQRAAVTTTEGYVRVAAGAGSGKTRVLTSRYVYIAKMLGIAPEHILSVTFTNKAAREMRSRIRKFMPDEDGGWILTFHGACHKILKEELHLLSYPDNFMVLDEEDQKNILQRIYSENGITLKDFPFRTCLDAIEMYKAMNDYVPFLTDTSRPLFAPGLDKADEKKSMDFIITEYMKAQRKNFWLDFADLIQFVLHLFKTHSAVLKKWQNKFEYIQIDEFQDVSGEQYKLAKLLSGKHKNLFIVGDPDQTIYSWRGADVSYFNDFDKRFPGTKTIMLDVNYRSTPQILAASNKLIAHNDDRLNTTLKASLPDGEKPRYFHARTRSEEAEHIASEIAKLKTAGTAASDIAVLYRGNYMSRTIETSLLKNKIAYVVYGSVEFYKRKEIKDALAYLRLTAFGDDLSFERTINTPPRGIGRSRMNILRKYADATDCSLLQALREMADSRTMKPTRAADFLSVIDRGIDFTKQSDPFNALDYILNISGYEEYLRLSGGQDRLDNLNELKSSVREYVQEEGTDARAQDYLNSISLLSNADTEDKTDCVKLMTVHTAKGLEFPYVFICCLNEGLFPSRKIKSKEEMEEERRVAYVALTRAQKRLYMSDAEGYKAGSTLYTSRFILEIGKDLLETEGKFSEGHLARSQIYINSSNVTLGIAQNSENRTVFPLNASVFHPAFGIGSVIDIFGGAYLIRFASGKTRSISINSDTLSLL